MVVIGPFGAGVGLLQGVKTALLPLRWFHEKFFQGPTSETREVLPAGGWLAD
jgi:hypothetical protein